MASAAPASPDADIGRPRPAPAPAPSSLPRPEAQLGMVSETAADVLLGPTAADRADTFRDGQPDHPDLGRGALAGCGVLQLAHGRLKVGWHSLVW